MDSQRLAATISAARAGRQEAFQEILAAYGPRLYGYFCRATGSPHDAEDLLGELLLRLLRRLGEYDEHGRFEPWLFSIAANLVRDRIRRSKVRPVLASLEAENPSGSSLGETIGGDDAPVESGLVGQEMRQDLLAAMAKLDERSREMVLLRHFGELSFKEIANMYNCPVGTVLAKVHRALKSLRTMLEDKHERP